MKLKWEIWAEGWGVPNDKSYHGTNTLAIYLDTVEANSFEEACIKLAEQDERFAKRFDRDRMTFMFGQRLFDNEKDARATFG